MIVENGEIGLIQVADKLAVLVGGDEENVHLVNSFVNGEQRAGLRIVLRTGRVGADSGRIAGVRLGKGRQGAGEGENRKQRTG